MNVDVELEQRLRDAFTSRADRTVVRADRPEPRMVDSQVVRNPRTWTPLIGVAAASVVLVGGLLAVRVATTEDVPPADTVLPSSVAPIPLAVTVVADPLAIDLDAWQPLPEAGDTGARFLVLDTERIADGFSVVDQEASTLLGGPEGRTQYVESLRLETADGVVFVAVEAYEFATCRSLGAVDDASNAVDDAADRAPGIDINGNEASVVDDAICWSPAPDVFASVRADGPSNAGATIEIDRLVEIARQLRFTEVDRLPASTRVERAPDAVELAPDDPDFAGSLGGREWSATVSETTLRGMQVYIDGEASSAFEHDRLSQPNDVRTSSGEASIGATPDAGALIYGYVMPEAANVIVRTGGDSVSLPLVRNELESYFAFPVPEGVVIDSVEFVDDQGVAIATLDLPPLPRSLSGSYGGFARVTRV